MKDYAGSDQVLGLIRIPPSKDEITTKSEVLRQLFKLACDSRANS